MSLDDDKDNARKRFEKAKNEVSEADVEKTAKSGQEKFESLDSAPPGKLKEIWGDIKWMLRLIKDYASGEYREIPWGSIAAITGAIIYFVSPVDVIPDPIPVVGYLDDAYVIKLALEFVKEDLDEYKKWKNA